MGILNIHIWEFQCEQAGGKGLYTSVNKYSAETGAVSAIFVAGAAHFVDDRASN